MIRSILFHQADASFYTIEDKISKYPHSDSATLLALNGDAFPSAERK